MAEKRIKRMVAIVDVKNLMNTEWNEKTTITKKTRIFIVDPIGLLPWDSLLLYSLMIKEATSVF